MLHDGKKERQFWNEIVWIVECEELVNVCSSVKCERYKKIGDFLEGSDSDVEFKCDHCPIQKRNSNKSWKFM